MHIGLLKLSLLFEAELFHFHLRIFIIVILVRIILIRFQCLKTFSELAYAEYQKAKSKILTESMRCDACYCGIVCGSDDDLSVIFFCSFLINFAFIDILTTLHDLCKRKTFVILLSFMLLIVLSVCFY